ncbi:hypothetical protein GYA19_03950 [Candidatus Beckwithbacteria bacterium]|nr:hypothetical protein [Candidatus Beckwithbacteria bacterium]
MTNKNEHAEKIDFLPKAGFLSLFVILGLFALQISLFSYNQLNLQQRQAEILYQQKLEQETKALEKEACSEKEGKECADGLYCDYGSSEEVGICKKIE